MSDQRKDEQGLDEEKLEGQEAELLPVRAAMMIIRPPLPAPFGPIGGGYTIEPPVPPTETA